MNRFIILFLATLLFLPACVEEIEGPDDTFLKIYGREADSQGFNISLTEAGEIIILGQTSTAGFDFTLTGGGGQLTEGTINRAPSISYADNNGNLLDRTLIPTTSIELAPGNEIIGYENSGIFKFMEQMANGNYFVIGEWLDVSIVIQGNEFPIPFNAPFNAILDPDFNLIDLNSYVLQPGWDGFLYAGTILKKHPDGSLYVFHQLQFDPDDVFAQDAAVGFAIQRLGVNGEEVWPQQRIYYNPGTTSDGGWDITFKEDGNLIIMGQSNPTPNGTGEVVHSELDHATGNLIYHERRLDSTEELGRACPGNLLVREGGYAAFYDDFPNIVINLLNENLISEGRIPITFNQGLGIGEGEFIRDAIITKNGEYLVLTEFVQQDDFTGEGNLLRVSDTGVVLWKYSFDGLPQDVIETSDGGILVLFNPQFNKLTPKTTVIKLSADGKL